MFLLVRTPERTWGVGGGLALFVAIRGSAEGSSLLMTWPTRLTNARRLPLPHQPAAAIGVGVFRLVVVPSPSCPVKFPPQQ